ncbi:hypothetical protein D1BOALGB6SA_4357 [Olavius sp. associated proteobacterium Delta 1]|nr:hypothetical protein D1BOALGB6SA_4357 [Olavius sp. associated proteobacterium Delta 1]
MALDVWEVHLKIWLITRLFFIPGLYLTGNMKKIRAIWNWVGLKI